MSLLQNDLLADYRWQNRVVLIFEGNSNADKVAQQTKELFDQADGLSDRDLIIIHIDQFAIKDALTDEVIAKEAIAFRESFDVPPIEFGVLLIGKDGGVKLRKDEVVSSDEIFALIDSMPMRRSEMRRKNGNQ